MPSTTIRCLRRIHIRIGISSFLKLTRYYDINPGKKNTMIILSIRRYFELCDEFITHSVEVQSIRIVEDMDFESLTPQETEIRQRFAQMVMAQREYKRLKGYGVLNGDVTHDRRLIFI